MLSLISAAYAAADTAAAAPPEPSFLMSALPLVVIFALFYILVLRPQSKRIRAHADLVNALKPGDQVVTGAGFYGKVVSIDGSDMVVEIAPGVNVRAQKHTISMLQQPTDIQPAK